jgi:hypothetical protein
MDLAQVDVEDVAVDTYLVTVHPFATKLLD